MFKCMVASTDDTENPIPVPNFISRQIVLDLVEIIERGTITIVYISMLRMEYRLDLTLKYLLLWMLMNHKERIIENHAKETYVLWMESDRFLLNDRDDEVIVINQELIKLNVLILGDTGQCAHLVLVSLSYLLDFLIAVDFLGFTEVKDTVEERVKMHINDASWKEIFHYTKDIIGLFNTTCHTIEYVCKRLQEGDTSKTPAGEKAHSEQGSSNLLSNQIAIMEQKPEARDPYEESYLNFPAVFFKVMLRSKHLLPR